MQSTMLILLALLAAQVTDQPDYRYPAQSAATDAEQTDSSSRPAESAAQERAASPSNFFDEIDAAAQPLNNEAQSSSEQQLSLEAEGRSSTNGGQSTFGTENKPGLGTESPPPAATNAPAMETDPAKLLASFLEPPLQNGLQGTSLSLAQAVDNSLSRPEQTQRVVAYWELSQAVANYYLAFRERTELAALQQGVAQVGADWELARQAAEDRVQLSLDRARVAQQHLTQVMGNATVGFSPLTSDLPFCGLYETRYEQIFASRPSPLAQQLNEFLARAHSDLSTRAHEVADARKWMFTVSDRRSPQSDGNELLKAYELFAARRRLFISAVKEYNLGIVRYTEIATPGTLETERLVAMLIRTGSSPGTTFDRDVQRVNAEDAAGLNDSSSTSPAGGWGSAPQSSAERSILVPRG